MGLSSKQVSNDMNCWNQDLLEGERIVEFPNTSPIKTPQQQQQAPPEKLNCPRCDSTNTKFCYYNNYNKSQPRHFCKACKRHWTKGGTLRNVPVGGGRKNKRLKPSKTVSKTTTITTNTNNNNNNNIATTLQSQQLRDSLPLGGSFYQNFLKQQQESSINFTSKGSNYANFLGPTTKNTSLALSTQNHDHHQEVQFPYSNYGSFESNPCSISSTITSIQSPILYNFTGDQVNNEGLLENDHHQHQHQPWNMHASTTRNNNANNIVMDMMSSNSNWGWDDIDKFVSVEADIIMPWDDAEIKP